MARTIRRYQDLSTALDDAYTVPILKVLAQAVGGARAARKADLVRSIAVRLRGDGLRRVWAELDELSQAAIAEIVHGESDFLGSSAFQAKYGGAPSWGDLTSYRPRSATPLGAIIILGKGQRQVPQDLRARLMEFVPPPRQERISSHADAQRCLRSHYADYEDEELDIGEVEQPAFTDLRAVLRLADMGRLRVGAATRKPTARTCKAVAEVLHGGDYYDPEDLEGPGLGHRCGHSAATMSRPVFLRGEAASPRTASAQQGCACPAGTAAAAAGLPLKGPQDL